MSSPALARLPDAQTPDDNDDDDDDDSAREPVLWFISMPDDYKSLVAAASLESARRSVLAAEFDIEGARRDSFLAALATATARDNRELHDRCTAHLSARTDALQRSVASLPQLANADLDSSSKRVLARVSEQRDELAQLERALVLQMQSDIAALRGELARERNARRSTEEMLRRLMDEVADALRHSVASERQARAALSKRLAAAQPQAPATTAARSHTGFAALATPPNPSHGRTTPVTWACAP